MTDRTRGWTQSPAEYFASARQHPYFAELYTGWSDHDPLVVGFQTEDAAREFAASRPEPIIDLVRRDDGIIAYRRLIVHPLASSDGLHDDFPQTEKGSER